ncbi:MAG: TRAM domain-containing protein [Haloferacaceae archaeon]
MPASDPYCLFSARIEERSGDYVVQIPASELDLGALDAGSVYRVGLYPAHDDAGDGQTASSTEERTRPTATGRTASADRADASSDGPPVDKGEILELEIEDVGDQGDGIARVGPGYVVFVPDAQVGDNPTVRVTTVRENFAFAERVE